MSTCKILIVSAALVMGLSATASQAALESRLGGQAVYDTNLNITWLADANFAATNSLDVSGIRPDGSMTWFTAQSWIAGINTSNYLGYNDWRLPSTNPVNGSFNYFYSVNGNTDVGYNISAPGSLHSGSTASELAYMYYVNLGNKAPYNTDGSPQIGSGLVNTGPFSNLQQGTYFSGTDFALFDNNNYAWVFSLTDGFQTGGIKDSIFLSDYGYAWAVRSGDVAVVPEPEAWGLMLSGLALVMARVLRKKLTRI